MQEIALFESEFEFKEPDNKEFYNKESDSKESDNYERFKDSSNYKRLKESSSQVSYNDERLKESDSKEFDSNETLKDSKFALSQNIEVICAQSTNVKLDIKANSTQSTNANQSLDKSLNNKANLTQTPSTSLNNKDFTAKNNFKTPENTSLIDYDVDFSKDLVECIEKNPNFTPLLRYNKSSNHLIFTNFTAFDLDLFMCFCFAAREKGNLRIKLKFSDFDFLMGKTAKNAKRLFKKLDEFCEKAMKVINKQEILNDKFRTHTYMGFFDSIKIYEKEKVIVIQFNNLMVSILNNITRYYTQFELRQYCALKSKYSKQLYSLLMENLYKGEFYIEKENLLKYFSINSTKREDNFTQKVIINSLKELKDLFKDLEFQKNYKNSGVGNRKVIAYKFTYKRL